MKRFIEDALSLIFLLIVFYIVAVYSVGCAHKQEMHLLQVQTSIAYSCWKSQPCVEEVTECYDLDLESYYSKLNLAEKNAQVFCNNPMPVFDEARTIKDCVRRYQKIHSEFK